MPTKSADQDRMSEASWSSRSETGHSGRASVNISHKAESARLDMQTAFPCRLSALHAPTDLATRRVHAYQYIAKTTTANLRIDNI